MKCLDTFSLVSVSAFFLSRDFSFCSLSKSLQIKQQINYLCTYDLYGPVHKVFDAGG